MQFILQLRNIIHRYNGRTVLDIPKLDIEPGSITGLAGPNGSGKSTLLTILSCTERCLSGTVFFNGRPVQPFDPEIRHRITMLPQETYLLRRSVFDNISYGLKIRKGSRNLRSAAGHALELVGLNQSFADRSWHELSGGEAQRVALAARLALKPECLLLDEPTASVDMESARFIRRALLLAQREWGTTLIIASHQQFWLNDISDRIISIYNGRILACCFENILLGPWKPVDSNLSCMELADGQKMYVQRPPQSESCAVFAPESLAVGHGPPQEGKKSLTGIMTGIFLDRQQDSPRIHVVCGDQRFVVSGADTPNGSTSCRPGEQITLHYAPEDVTWLSE